MDRRDTLRQKALQDLQGLHVLMLNGHFDFGNGYHGKVYLNPHQHLRHPSTIWRFAQDLLDVLPASLVDQTEIVAGPVTGGALLAHTVAGLLDSRRELSRARTLFAPFTADESGQCKLSRFYAEQVKGHRVLIVDDVRNTGQTLAHCAKVAREAGGSVIGTAQIYDRLEAMIEAGVPNFALAEYKAPENYAAGDCPLCRSGVPVATF